MSMKNVKKFMELVKAEESLAKRMVALKDGLQEGEFHFKNDKEFVEKKILPLAKEYGIEFSVEDFIEFTNSQLTSLSEEELAEVSGGFPGIGLIIGLSVFLGGAATPTIASKAVSYFTGGGTSTVQSVSEQDVDMSGAKTGAIVDRGFKNAKRYLSRQIKDAFNNINSYMSPEARSTWMEKNANKEFRGDQNKLTNKKVHAKYDKNEDVVTFTATWDNRLNDFMNTTKYSQAALNDKLSNILKQQFNAAYDGEAAQLAQQWNNLNQLLQQNQTSLSQYAPIDQYRQSINTGYQTINNLIFQLQPSVYGGTLDMNTDFTALKERFMAQGGQWYDGTYYYKSATQINLIDQILEQQKTIKEYEKSAQTINALTQKSSQIESQMKEISNKLHPYAAKQQAFIDNMKTEFDYFYGELVKALKKDEEISKIAKKATTAEDKATLANKIKEKADQLVQKQFSKQLLNGCSLGVDLQGNSIVMQISYSGYCFHQGSFSIDEFISAENHNEIVNSESSKKREEIISKIANHVNSNFSSSTELKVAVQSVLEGIKNKTLDLKLGVNITITPNNKGITFSFTSGGRTLTTSFGSEAVVDKCKQLKNMQAIEATRQQKEGTIAYTPFDRTLFNSIGSQARHVLDTLSQIKDLSEVQDREAFENDLNYVAENVLTKGDSPFGLKGKYHTDKSIKTVDLQTIQKFAKMMIKNDN